MKTRILSLMMMMVVMLMATSAFAQPTEPASTSTVTAKDGSVVTYTVNGTGTFTWAIARASGSGTAPSLDSDNDNSQELDWTTAVAGDVYNLDVYLVDANNCYSEMVRYQITIESVVLSIADASSVTCSWLNGSASDESGNTVSANDQFTFDLSTDAAGTITPISVNYSVTGGTGTDTRTNAGVAIVSEAGELVVDIDSYFGNTSGSDATFTITLTGATDADGNPLGIDAANDEATITVHSVPTITLN